MEFFKLAGNIAYSLVERVELPRRIVIKNIRLGLALRAAQIVAAAFVVWLVFWRSQWVKTVSPYKAGILTGWDDTPSYDTQNLLDLTSGFCTRLSTLDYVYSSNWRYDNYSCSSPVQKYDRLWKEGDFLIYAPTAFEESHVQGVNVGDAGDCSRVTQECIAPEGWVYDVGAKVCRCSTRANFLVTGVDALTIAFDHEYSADVSASAVVGGSESSGDSLSSQRSDVSCDKVGRCDAQDVPDGKTKELKTVVVVVDKDGEEQLVKIFDAPSTVRLPVQDLFAKSGISLDSETPTIESLLHCDSPDAEQPCSDDVPKLPTARQTGMAITFNLQYSNRLLAPQLPCDDCLANHVGPVCKAVVTLEPSWQSRPRNDCEEPPHASTGDASCTSRYYYGLKVSFNASGTFGVFDIVTLMVTIGAALVYLGIPLIIINAIALYLIGALSSVYKKADREEVAVDTQLAGFVIRMIMAQSAYVAVTGGEDNTMTKEMLLERIHACVKRSDKNNDLDDHEQIKLAELVMQVLDIEQDKTIHLHEFVHAVTSNDAVNLRDAVRLFDDDRKLGCLERVFKTRSFASHCNHNSYFEKEGDKYKIEGDLKQIVTSQRLSARNSQASEASKNIEV